MAIPGEPTKAYLELKAIRNLSAFSIVGAKRRNVNQHARDYTFPDGSILRIFKNGRAQSYLSKGGLCDCVSLIRCNAFGN